MTEKTQGPTTAVRPRTPLRRTRLAPLAVLGAFVFGGGSRCGVETQSAVHYASDSRPIESLDRFANPLMEDSISGNYLGRALGASELRVAIIDNGVDYTHPELAAQIAFGAAAQGPRAAGFDAMGDDEWAHPNLIDPSFFAFGAQVQGGKISAPVNDPLTLITRLHEDFSARLQLAIESDPVLATSLFARIKGSISPFGAWTLLNTEEFRASAYEELKEEGRLATPEKVMQRDERGLLRQSYRWMSRDPWVMNATSGTPIFYEGLETEDTLWEIEHADAFAEALRQVYEAFDAETGFGSMLDSYVQYRLSFQEDSSSVRSDIHQSIQKSWHKTWTSYGDGDETLALVRDLCQDGFSPEAVAELTEPGKTEDERAFLLEQRLGAIFHIAQRISETVVGHPELFDADKVKSAKGNLDRLEQDKRDFLAFVRAKGINNFTCESLSPRFSDASQFAEYGRRYLHPYLSEKNRDAHHGTHVAGIVASQSPDLRIVPVRVTTQSTETSPERQGELLSSFIAEFSAWLESPQYAAGIDDALKKVFPDLNGAADRRAAFMERAQPLLKDELASNSIELIFMDDIVKAIQFVGQEKIKVANVSLGTSFEAAPASPIEEDPEARLPAAFKFLRFEFFKHKVASAILTSAPQTLFVIASGNDGKWVDGKSRSALPCDLSSPYFASYESADTPPESRLPGERIRNILCVGSINPSDELSSFSNLPITQVPFVLSYGESILSSIRLGNCEGSDQVYAGRVKETSNYRYLEENEATVDLAVELGFLSEEKRSDAIAPYFAIEEMNGLVQKSLGSFRGPEKLTACVTQPRTVARLSGTSMATPAVAGRSAKLILDLMQQAGLSEGETWASDDFSPRALINALKATAPVYGGESLIAGVHKIVDVLPWLGTAQSGRQPFLAGPHVLKSPQFVFLSEKAPASR